MGYATVKAGKERPLQKMYNGWAPGPGSARSWHCSIGWAERAQLHGGDHVHHCPHKGTFLGLYLSEVLEKDP